MPIKSRTYSRRLRFCALWLAGLACFIALNDTMARPHSSKGKSGGTAASDEQLETGMAAVAAGRFAQAEQIFYRVFASETRPELLFYLGRMAAAQGEGVVARDLMRRYLQDPEREANTNRQAIAQLLLDEPPPLGVQVAEVTVIGPRGAWIRVDGRLLGWLPLLSALQLTAGAHTVAIESSSGRLSGQALLTPGFDSEVRFNLDARTVLSSAPPPLLSLIKVTGSSADARSEKKLLLALQDAAMRDGVLILSRDEALKTAGDLEPCLANLPCQLDLASRNEAFGVLQLQVEAKPGSARGQHSLRAQFVDLVAGQVVAVSSDACDACQDSDLVERAVQTALRCYREAWSRPRARLQVTVNAQAAEVQVNGRTFRHLPLRLAPLPGTVSIVARAPGFAAQRRSVAVTANQATNLELVLQPGDEPALNLASPTTSQEKNRLRSTLLFWGGAGAIGAGLILAGFGISGLSLNGACGPGAPPGAICPEVYDTQAKGGALLGVGIGLSVAGTVGMVIGREAIKPRNN